MTILNRFLIFNLLIQCAWAIPRFAIRNGTTCSTCHVSPTGSDMRNDYGVSIVSMEELPTVSGQKKTDDSFTGFLTDNIQLRADLRLQFLSYSDGGTLQQTALFPMQADVYGPVSIHPAVEAHVELDLLRGNSEIWTSLNILPNEGYIQIGRKIPHYGLPLDDHTSFIRGGNLRLTHGLEREGMPFSPLIPVPGMVEAGILLSDFFITGSISNGYVLGSSQGYGFSEFLSDKTFTGRLEYSKSFDRINELFGASVMKEQEFFMRGLFGGLSLGRWVWLGEIDLADNWVGDGNTSLVSFSELSFEPVQGIQVIAKYDFFDEDIDFTENALTLYTGVMEIYPYNFLEIKAQVRFTTVAGEKTQSKPEFLLQFHTWF